MPPRVPLPVVCAIIRDAAGRVLLAQRPAHKHLGLKWEFAGGKVETDEAPEAALIREIREELGCDIRVDHALPSFVYDYETVAIEMLPFLCSLAPQSAVPHPHEHVAVRWVSLEEIAGLDLAPADWPVVAMLKSGQR